MSAVTPIKPPALVLHTVNPVVRAVLRSPFHGAVDGSVFLLHVTGRRTGRRYDIPVRRHELDGRIFAVTSSGWRANLRGGADIQVTGEGNRRPMRVELDEDPASVAAVHQRFIEHFGWEAARRELALKSHVGRPPTLAELEEAVREFGLSVITLRALNDELHQTHTKGRRYPPT